MSTVILTSTEIKLLHLALNKSAAEGEVRVGAVKFIESLRRRGVEANAIEQALAEEPIPEKQLRPDYGRCIMPWGKFKGQIFADVAPSYLRNQVSWVRSDPELLRKFAAFVRDAEAFLNA